MKKIFYVIQSRWISKLSSGGDGSDDVGDGNDDDGMEMMMMVMAIITEVLIMM